ncbi:hypothetical protein [Paenibacillus thalictri]|uniref:hypothetical protein n=1 Tax=Paenibacillus thalictri TaxID=2527873 RepID=UPI001F0F03E0|nr:hypothetical protein [Paenibacillus thalictri]
MKRGLPIALLMFAVLIAVTGCSKPVNQDTTGHDSGGHGSHGESAASGGPAKGGGTQPSGNGDHADNHSGHSGQDTAAADTTKAIWKLSADKPQPKSDVTVTVTIQDAQGRAVDKFDINHEKKMHLIIVSKDLSYFDHIHPEYKGEGRFEVTTQFPAAGDYKLIADYMPTGGAAATQTNWVTVSGNAAAPAAVVADQTLVKTVAGKEVTLAFDHLMAGMDTNMTFHITDQATKKPVTDLQPYLGAVGHVVILSADTEQYLHVHPTDEKAKGPDAKFMTKFPKSGVYKIWGQFQQNGQTFIVPFVVNVP